VGNFFGLFWRKIGVIHFFYITLKAAAETCHKSY